MDKKPWMSQTGKPPDFMLADVSMSKVNGFEVCRFLKFAPAKEGTAVVLFRGFVQESFRRRGSEVGADDIMSKPFYLSELHRKLDGVWPNNGTPT